MELGELVSFYRRRAGLTIDELAEKSGVPKSTINKIIGGTTKAPTLENVKSIARALGVRLADFDNEPELADMFSAAEQDVIQKYRLLDPYGKEAVDSILNIEHRRCMAYEENAQHSEQAKDTTKLYIAARDGSRVETEEKPEAGDDFTLPEEDTRFLR